MKKELDCIVCPMSCHIDIEMDEQGNILNITGNTCPRGAKFAQQEMTCPLRQVTTTVRVYNGIHDVIPVIISNEVPKSKIFDIMEACKKLEVKAPVHSGDVLIANVADSGADLLASRSMEMRNTTDGCNTGETEGASCH